MRPIWHRVAAPLIIALLASAIAPARTMSSAPFTIAYTLTLAIDDRPEVDVKVAGAQATASRFRFGVAGGVLASAGDLKSIFTDIAVTASNGSELRWSWQGDDQILVENGPQRDFTIHYTMDALRVGRGPEVKWVLFRKHGVFFTADAVFLLPTDVPDRITVGFSLPEGMKVYASIPEVNGEYVAAPDLWGNLLDDFQKVYFSGGRPLFDLTRTTSWGDTYRYVWFDRDPLWAVWSPGHGLTPWEAATREMALMEQVSRYYREKIGPLPARTVLFTNLKWGGPGIDSVKNTTDWFHHMEIWPAQDLSNLVHHAFHAYSFFVPQSKLAFNHQTPIGQMLTEGLPTYLEVTLPAELFGQEYVRGKLYEFYVFERRGAAGNSYQQTYNRPALQVYLLDQYIRRVTGGAADLTTFVKALWDQVGANPHPQQVTDGQITAAFGSVVGQANQGYISRVAAQTAFTDADFAALLPDFRSYVSTMSDRYFWGNPLLFLAYLDLAATIGGEWPHFATAENQVKAYRPSALERFRQSLAGRPGSLTPNDIEDAMDQIAGDHSGFFTFWADRGFDLQPNSLTPTSGWTREPWDAASLFPVARWISGTLQTEHYLSGLTQEATILLDRPAPADTMGVQVSLYSPDAFPPQFEADQALSGSNVRYQDSLQMQFGEVKTSRAFFRVTTNDPERRRFQFRLTLPSFSSHPQFAIYEPSRGPERGGDVYYLHPFDPILFDLQPAGADQVLPDTALDGESFVIHAPGGDMPVRPGQCVAVSGSAPVMVDLLDAEGFLRGRQNLPLPSGCSQAVPPAASAPVRVVLNGSPVTFDVPPVRSRDRLLVPLRALGEALGAQVSWDPGDRSVTMRRGSGTVSLVIGSHTALVNGAATPLDAPPEIREGRTLVPLRFIAESLGLDVKWDDQTQTAILTSK